MMSAKSTPLQKNWTLKKVSKQVHLVAIIHCSSPTKSKGIGSVLGLYILLIGYLGTNTPIDRCYVRFEEILNN